MGRHRRDNGKGNISGELPKGAAEDARLDADPPTIPGKAMKALLETTKEVTDHSEGKDK